MEIVADEPTGRVELLLNNALEFRRFEASDGASPKVERGITISGQALPKTQRVDLQLAKPLVKGERLRLTFAYAGRLTTSDIEIGRGVVSPGWSELTLEALWYPVWLKEPIVRSVVNLELPEAYEVVGPGEAVRTAAGRWRLDPKGPISGRITFAASNDWRVESLRLNPKLEAALHTVTPEPRGKTILEAVGGAYADYERLFGPPRADKSKITLLLANADIGLKYPNQAYSTGGDFIVLSSGSPESQQDTLHHEVAHLWWSAGRPGTPDEFMSESVSEYLALRRGEAVWGGEWLAKRRRDAAKASAEVKGSITAIDGFSGLRQPLLYERGPTALWALHDRIGGPAMDRLLVAAYQARIDTLQAFLDLLARQQDAETAAWFEARL